MSITSYCDGEFPNGYEIERKVTDDGYTVYDSYTVFYYGDPIETFTHLSAAVEFIDRDAEARS